MILKCAPQLGNIDTIKRFLEFFLDPKFIAREQIKLRTLAGKKYYSAIIPVKIHPAIAILDCLNFLIQNDPLTLPKDFEYYMRDLIVLSLTASSMFKVSNNDLNKLGPSGFIKRVRDRILDKRGFYHVLYELQVAALMNSIHKTVHFEDVSDKKWPDLLISEADKSYYLECKSLESPKALYARLSVEILQLLEKMKINAQIELLLNRQPSDSTAITTITAEIQSMLQSGTMQKCDESKADIKITLLDNLYKGDLISPGGNADYDYLAIGSWGKRDSDGISWWKDPMVVTVKNKNRPSPERAMIKEISNGYKQIRNIPNDAIGIICMDISSYITAGMQHNSQEFMAIFEDAKKTINDLFKGPHYKRLGGIIMTWNYQKMTPTGSIRVAINVDGIVHNKSTKPMPEEFLKGEYKGQKMVFVPRDPTVVIEEGVALFKRGKVEDSVEHFDMVTTHYPQLIEGWIYKAICLRKMKKYVEALSSLKQALAIDPKHRLGLLSLAQCYADLGMKDNASKTLDDMIQIFPNDAQLWYNRALMFYEQGDKESARRCIQKSLEYKSDYEPAMNLSEKLNKNDWDGQYSEDISSNRFN